MLTVDRCRLGAEERARWDEYVQGCPSATPAHLGGWGRVIERAYGHTPLYLWAHEGPRVRGVLPLVLFAGPFGRRALVSMPFLDDGGVCADDERAKAALWEAALGLMRDFRATSVDFRGRDPSGLRLARHRGKVTLVRRLTPDPDSMWKGLDATVRNQVRKATKCGLVACWSGIEALDEFYDVFAANMRDLGSPVHARRFFATILEEFGERVRLVVVRRDRRSVAGGVCFYFRDTVGVPWASALREYRPMCPNNLLYWEVMRASCQKGFAWLDFGRSSPGSGTYRFKKQWGATDRPLHWEYLNRGSGRSPLVSSDDPRYGWLIKVWQRLPVGLTRVIGPPLRRRLAN